MKVIYCVSELLDWIDVAKYFQNTKNWEPLFWLTTSKNIDYVTKNFPLINKIDFYYANRGILEDIPLEKKIILSKPILLEYLKFEKIVLKMMDRMDPTGYSFNTSERTQLYYIILEFLLNYIENNNPEIIIFNESPHSPFTYLIYAIAVQKNIRILRLSPTHINANTFLASNLDNPEIFLKATYEQTMKDKHISDEVTAVINSINSTYENATPYYMDKIIKANKQNNFYKIGKSFTKFIRYYFNTKQKESYYKTPHDTIRSNYKNKDLALNTIKSTLYKISLQKKYMKYVNKSSEDFSINDSFIYFPLQYQPEKSTSPEGDIFSDQYLAINMLSGLSKGKYKIYIKEHISQFSIKLHGEQGRLKSFYHELSLLENVIFVDSSVSSFSLIDNSIAVATITGTAGFEAVVRNKPSIIFGFPWYKNCHGVFHVQSSTELSVALNKILDKYQIDADKIKYFLQSIFNISEKIYLNHSNKNSIQNKDHNNTKSIIALIEKYENQYV